MPTPTITITHATLSKCTTDPTLVQPDSLQLRDGAWYSTCDGVEQSWDSFHDALREHAIDACELRDVGERAAADVLTYHIDRYAMPYHGVSANGDADERAYCFGEAACYSRDSPTRRYVPERLLSWSAPRGWYLSANAR